MKITPIKAFFGSLTIASAMFMIPSSTFATETNVVSPSIHINQSGDIKLTGAEVTSITETPWADGADPVSAAHLWQ